MVAPTSEANLWAGVLLRIPTSLFAIVSPLTCPWTQPSNATDSWTCKGSSEDSLLLQFLHWGNPPWTRTRTVRAPLHFFGPLTWHEEAIVGMRIPPIVTKGDWLFRQRKKKTSLSKIM